MSRNCRHPVLRAGVALLILLTKLLIGCGLNQTAPISSEVGNEVPAPTATAPPPTAPAAAKPAVNADDLEEVQEVQPANDQLVEIPRNETLVIGDSSFVTPAGVTNPWHLDYNLSDGNAFQWEGLAYYRIFADENQPWLAQSMVYTKEDFTELKITLRPQARWSDGTQVTSTDVVFTLEGHLNNDLLPHYAAFDQFVASIEAVDDLTTVITFNQPAPRFAFEILTLKFDTGIPIVPAHVLQPLDDPTAFAGGPEMPHSGPYSIVVWDASQKVFDLNDSWWAIEAGLIDTPQVRRIIIEEMGSKYGYDWGTISQRIVENHLDTVDHLPPSFLIAVHEENPAVITHTGSQPPHGYLDWWPNSLWVNTLLPPYDDPRVRRALSLAIDRREIDERLYGGAQISTIFPFPLYPGLEKFAASDDVQALIEQYEPGKFDPAESAQLMEAAGFALNSDGLWERNGQTVNAVIHGFGYIHSDIAPLLERMLRDAGFDAAVNFGGNTWGQMTEGAPGLYLFGHGASTIDPYATLEMYHSRFSRPLGMIADAPHFSRYSNPTFDALLDEMAILPADDPRFHELAVQALEIYWREQIDIPVIQWLHHIPYNQTYWTNWPTADNLGPGVNGAYFAYTGMLVAVNLKMVP